MHHAAAAQGYLRLEGECEPPKTRLFLLRSRSSEFLVVGYHQEAAQ